MLDITYGDKFRGRYHQIYSSIFASTSTTISILQKSHHPNDTNINFQNRINYDQFKNLVLSSMLNLSFYSTSNLRNSKLAAEKNLFKKKCLFLE